MGWDPAARQHGGIRPEAACRERTQQDPACPKGAAPRSRRAPVHRQGSQCGIPPRLCCTAATARGGGGTLQRRGQWGPQRGHQHAWAHPRLGPARRAACGDSVLENGALLQQQQMHRALPAALRLQTQPQGGPCPSSLCRAAPGPGMGKWGPAPGWGLGIGCRASPARQCSGNSHARAAGPQAPPGRQLGGARSPPPGGQCAIPTATVGLASLAPAQGGCCCQGHCRQPALLGELWVGARDARSCPQTTPTRCGNCPEAKRRAGAQPGEPVLLTKTAKKHLWSMQNISRKTHYVLGSVMIIHRDG